MQEKMSLYNRISKSIKDRPTIFNERNEIFRFTFYFFINGDRSLQHIEILINMH